jgi:DNA (cytosine-5)-methyltransferase 1
MRIGSLFSGAGGLDMAVEAVFGGHTVWHSEIDKAASKVLAHRWPDVPNLGSITEVDWSNWKPLLDVDIICGGWPCQPFSLAGKRKGINDDRALWPYVAGAIRVLRPRYVVLENVSAVLTAGEFDRVAADLAACGYSFGWTCARASDVGAPHRRERVFIVAHAEGYGRDEGRPEPARLVGGSDAAVSGDGHGYIGHRDRYGTPYASNAEVDLLPTPTQSDGTGGGIRTGLSWEGTTKSTGDGGNSRLRDVAGLLGPLLPTPRTSDTNGAGHHGDGGMDLRTTVTLLPTPRSQDGNGYQQSPTADVGNNGHTVSLADRVTRLLPTPAAQDGNGGGRYSSEGQQSTLPGEARLLCTPSASDGAGGKTSRSGGRIDEPLLGGQAREMESSWGKYEPAIRRWEQIVGPAPAPTEPNKNNNPRLSAAFSEWLMGWPAGWVTDPAIGISRNDQLRIVGNGVCTQQAIAALRYLLEVTA